LLSFPLSDFKLAIIKIKTTRDIGLSSNDPLILGKSLLQKSYYIVLSIVAFLKKKMERTSTKTFLPYLVSDVARPRPPIFSRPRPRPIRPKPRPLFQDQDRFFLKTIKLLIQDI